jgi:hypothetical protein
MKIIADLSLDMCLAFIATLSTTVSISSVGYSETP